MGATQLDIIRRQVEAAARNAVTGAAGRLRRDTSLVNKAAQLAGRALQKGGQAGEKRWNRRSQAPQGPQMKVEMASSHVCPAEDGYIRRSPIQPVREAADYRRRLLLRGAGAVALIAAVCIGVALLNQLGLFGR